MLNKVNQILTAQQITQKIKRIAFEIYENNFEEKELVLVGIEDMGFILAERLFAELENISPLKLKLVKLSLNKSMPTQSEVKLDTEEKSLENQTIILVDDVLNTGRTMAYSLKPFLSIRIKKLQTVVLVDRSHHVFPISADFVGYSLATTIKEHIQVVLNDAAKEGVYLD